MISFSNLLNFFFSFSLLTNAAPDSFDDFSDDTSRPFIAEKLKRLYPENERLIASIPSRIYEVIYPVQIRQHIKLGISTRETGANKTGEHYHQTSLLIKAFNYKFRIDLELNTHLLAPNLIQKHFLPEGAQQISTQEIEHCYYHGTTRDYPGAIAAFRTCNGVSCGGFNTGILHVGNDTFVIHPFYGGDQSKKHPHVIYRYFSESKDKHTCGNTGMHEWGFKMFRMRPTHQSRLKKDVRQVNKFVELALVLDQAMFDNRNASRNEVVNDAIQIVNCVDMYFRTVNTRVSVVYVETWAHGDQMEVTSDVRQTLLSFMEYASRKLYKVAKDATHLLTGHKFRGHEVGMAVPDSICTAKAVGVSEDSNIYEPHLIASTVTHMLGHNIGMSHDHYNGTDCKCDDWWGCIMAQTILGVNKIQPYHFSTCSLQDYINSLRIGHGICLFNKPNQLEDFRTCGNNVVEKGEECDCGSIDECMQTDPCCDPITCKLKVEAECSVGPCCEDCKLRRSGHQCRPAATECDIPEFCDGEDGQCPVDLFKKNGAPCKNGAGYCFHGGCPTPDDQCEYLWGFGAMQSEYQCFQQFNTQGSLNGHCGSDNQGGFIKCTEENIKCGSLQCQRGSRTPMIAGNDKQYTRTIVSIGGQEYECKVTSGTITAEIPDLGLVMDGTKCAEGKICVNQTCVNVDVFIEPGSCPTNNIALSCSGHGVCSNINTCHCDKQWTSADCSQPYKDPGLGTVDHINRQDGTVEKSGETSTDPTKKPPLDSQSPLEAWRHNTSKSNIPYEVGKKDVLSTPSLVIVLVCVVGGVFIFFALLATCYRRQSAMPKPDATHLKKHTSRKFSATQGSIKPDECSSQENVNRIITFGSMPSYREDKLQELKRQQVLQLKDTSCSDGEELLDETSAFIELSPNNLSKVPEKGILKHAIRSGKEKWSDEASQSDNDIISHTGSHSERNSDALTEVERTLKSLNGYHEEILEALHTVSSHRPVDSQGSPQDTKKTFPDTVGDYSVMKGSSEHLGNTSGEEVEDMVPPCGPIRIRNLEDLLRQLEHQPHHVSPAGSDLRLSEPEADRHYRVDRTDSASGTESQLEPGLQFYLGRKQQPSSSDVSSHFGRGPPHDADEEEEEEFDEEGSIEEEVENGNAYASQQFVRSASEEALTKSYKSDYPYEQNLNSKHLLDKTLKRDMCEYVPSPPSDEVYDGLFDDKGYFPPSAIGHGRAPLPLTAPPSSSSSTSGSQPPSGAKRKGKKKFPEYKV
ncbi:disintegrin and metalloproteinase domain-containing protein 12 [Caerostris darwini]|uniref:Disintegrin and metalloproteinase domain-containing protein 12 n=1 Tax=Caerostris darwini TaxID=1538125 RepID=A0AAV4VSJ2_9ARAC|nr:disintegrin and metalloproteinase domain-containing protein 12 [Caerostris darwini]